jgi:prepilin-type processing-associated H-X9-DG protein
MSLGYIQANDGTSKTFMVSENLHAWYYSYGLANDVSTIKDTKHLFGFVWKNRPGPTERINGDRYYDHVQPPPANMETFAVVGSSTAPPNQFESYGFPSSNHPGGVNVAFAGGQITFIAETIDPLVYGQLCTPNRNRSSLADYTPSQPVPERRMPAPPDNAY